ncbi:MAG: hypothetical protein H0T05_05345 [Acidobacteria bacterium]|nr:hypothetical protein [Acidobacteriota bacterium]MBA3886085.1 hypothetical protein [Acidobacteriota bacterium]
MQQKFIGAHVYFLVLAGALTAGALPAGAQEPPLPPTGPPPVQVFPPAAQDPVGEPELVMKPEQAPRAIDPLRRREQIVAMEGLLTSAVKSGATAAARQMQALEPGLQLFTGVARAKGFYLDDYGVFFHVEIPGVSPSVSWLLNMAREPSAFEGERAQPTRASERATMGFDPDAAYVLAVQQKLIDAMLDYRIDLQSAEWLTVAARDGEGPMNPGQIVESAMMILRVRASDLADYYASRITREEIRRKVEVREF